MKAPSFFPALVAATDLACGPSLHRLERQAGTADRRGRAALREAEVGQVLLAGAKARALRGAPSGTDEGRVGTAHRAWAGANWAHEAARKITEE